MSIDTYKFVPHAFTRSVCSYRYCAKCGLIRLHNALTDWCVDKGCNYDDHTQYAAKVHKLTAP